MKRSTLKLCLLFPVILTGKQTQTFEKGIYDWSRTLAETFHVVQQKYFQDIDPQEPMIKAINSFVSSLDPHSSFMDPKFYTNIIQRTQGEFGGIGIVIEPSKEREEPSLTIIDTIPAGPADKAGVRAHDKIVQIDDEILKGLAVDEIIEKLKGKPGSSVRIKIQRATNKELLDLTITREIVKDQNAICYHIPEHNIYYLGLNLFTQNSIQQIEQLLKKSQQQKAKALILDLRNNSGGLMAAVVDIAGLFLPKGSLVATTKDRDKKVMDRYMTRRDPIADKSVPIFIMTNNFTASAAEILAGALRVYSDKQHNTSQVFLVGSKTHGKGSVQEVIPVSNDCALRLTIALYYLPDDTTPQTVGITPDFELEQRFAPTADMAWFTTYFGYEGSSRDAIKNGKDSSKKKTEDASPKTWQEKKMDAVATDYMLLSTVRLIEMYDMAQHAYPEKMKKRSDALNFLQKNYSTGERLAVKEITL